MIENKFLYYKTIDSFLGDLDKGLIRDDSIVFIKDNSSIWSHGNFYYCSSPNGYSEGMWRLKGNEGGGGNSNPIYNRFFPIDSIGVGAILNPTGDSIQNSIAFKWYNTEWVIGNIRDNNMGSRGFGIGLVNSDGKIDLGLKINLNSVSGKSFSIWGGKSGQFMKADGSLDSTEYLPKSGGTVSSSDIGGFTVKREGSKVGAFTTYSNEGGLLGRLGIRGDTTEPTPTYVTSAGENKTIWHEGNDGSGSGLDADMLDGKDGLWYRKQNLSFSKVKTAGETNYIDLNVDGDDGGILYNYYHFDRWKNAPNGMSYGQVFTLKNSDNIALAGQLAWDVYHNNSKPTGKLWWRANSSSNGWGEEYNWKQIAFTDSSVDMVGGKTVSQLFAERELFIKEDYQHYVILLFNLNKNGYHRVTGKLYTQFSDSLRYQAADIDIWYSRWGNGTNESYYRFDTYGIGTGWNLVTCTYEGEKWLALQHTNAQKTRAYYIGTSTNTEFKSIYYRKSYPTDTIINSEINDSIERCSNIRVPKSNGNSYALVTDNVASSDKLTTPRLINEDLNNYKDENFSSYYAMGGNSCLNKPSGVDWFGLQVIRTAGTSVTQVITTENAIQYKRYWNNITWSPWKKLLTEDDIPKNVVFEDSINFGIREHGEHFELTGQNNLDAYDIVMENASKLENINIKLKGAGVVKTITSYGISGNNILLGITASGVQSTLAMGKNARGTSIDCTVVESTI